jgi:hypothetical protein
MTETTDPFDPENLRITKQEAVELQQQRRFKLPRIVASIRDMLNEWEDSDFGYDLDYDFFAQPQAITRPDGKVLYPVCCLTSAAHYAVFICTQAREIWLIDLRKMRPLIEYERPTYVRYVPAARHNGQPSARGYVLPCSLLEEVGHCFTDDRLMKGFQYILDGTNKSIRGVRTEKVARRLVERGFFPEPLRGEVREATREDNRGRGIDLFVNDIPIQIKLDGKGGRRGTGNLFFQTHTLSVQDSALWFEHDKPG